METQRDAPTAVTVVVHQDDFFEQVCRGMVDHAVYRPQDDRQSFIHKDEDDRDLGKVLRVGQLLTPGQNTDISVSVWTFNK